jgi:hypothetical protein
MSNGTEACRPIYMRSTIISTRFSGVNRHSHTHRHLPGLRLQRLLDLARRRDGIARTRENRKNTVPFATLKNDRAVVRFDSAGHDLIVTLQGRLSFGRMRFPRSRRAFHVREQKGHGPDGAFRHCSRL